MDDAPRLLHTRSPRAFFVIAFIAALLIPIVAFAETGGTSYTLMVSKSSSRTSATPLSGAQLSGEVYVFLTPTNGVKKASFWLDNSAMTGTPTHVEGYAPLDFAGTDSAGKAKPFDLTKLGPGNHAISVKIETSSDVSTVTTAFTVGVGGATAAPTGQPVATLTNSGPTTAPAAPNATSAPVPTDSPTTAPVVNPAPTPLPAGFVGRSGTDLILAGRPFTFTGFNIYQANSRSNCSYTMGSGSSLNAALSGAGAGVFRSWFFQSLATTNGQRDWSAFDHTLAVARAHGVKVIVTLSNQWGSCEGSGYKWASWYTGGYKTQVLPGSTVPYRQWVQEIVSRYKDDPTIAMWQLMNEAEVKLDNTSTCAPATDLYNFAADVSGVIKSIDPNHLVSLGTMGAGQCGSQGSDYKLINSPATIDVCEYHDYGHETEALPANLVKDIAACNSLGKPIFVGESGIKISSVGGTLAARAAAFDAKCAAMFNAGIKGFLVWSWNNSPSSGSWQVGPGDPTVRVIDSY
jgi:mannan endo-1,4-beta-mannosidase